MGFAGNRLQRLPIQAALGWSLATIVLFEFGPFEYDVDNKHWLYAFLVAVHVALYAGFEVGLRRGSPVVVPERTIKRIVGLCAAVLGIELTLGWIANPGSLTNAGVTLSDPSLARDLKEVTWVSYLQIFTAPLSMSFLPLAACYWHELGWKTRAWTVLVILLGITASIATATRHGMLAMMVFGGAGYLAALRSGQRRARWLPTTAVAVVVVFGFLIYGSYIADRRQNPIYSYEQLLQFNQRFNPAHPLVLGTPELIRPAVLQGIGYFTHGYDYLARSLSLPFEGVAFGAGHSRFLTRNVVRVTGDETFLRRSYFFRLYQDSEFQLNWWMTVYPWIASDVTFPGTVVVMFLIAMAFGMTWADIRVGQNPSAVVLFTWLTYVMVSLPQGAPTQDGPTFVAIYAVLIAWFVTRRPSVPTARARVTTRPVPPAGSRGNGRDLVSVGGAP